MGLIQPLLQKIQYDHDDIDDADGDDGLDGDTIVIIRATVMICYSLNFGHLQLSRWAFGFWLNRHQRVLCAPTLRNRDQDDVEDDGDGVLDEDDDEDGGRANS